MRSLSSCLMVWSMLFPRSLPASCFCPRAVEVAERAKRAITNVVLIKNSPLNNLFLKIMSHVSKKLGGCGVAAITEASKYKYTKPSLRSAMPSTFGYNQWRDFEARHCPPTPNVIWKLKLQIYTEPRHWL